MTTLAQIVDESDAVLFDLNDPTGAANPGGVKTGVLHNADLGSIPTERDFFNPTASPGSLLVHKRHGLVVTRFGVLMRASSSDDLLTGVRELGRLLDGPGRRGIRELGRFCKSSRYPDRGRGEPGA